MGALFVRSLRGRGGTRKQLGSHSKELEEQSTSEGGAGPGQSERGQQGRPPAALTPREGAVSWPLRGRGESRVGLQAELGSLW